MGLRTRTGIRPLAGTLAQGIALLVVSASLALVASPADAVLSNTTKKCASLVVIGARGSGQSASTAGSIHGFGPQAEAGIRNAMKRVKRTGTVRYRSLTKSEYPAIPVDWTISWSPTKRKAYWDSVGKGARSTMSIARNIASNCRSTKIALVGYSQGASVMRWAIRDLPRSVRDRVALVGLIGDPQRRGYDVRPSEIGLQQDYDVTEGGKPLILRGSGALGAGPVLPSDRASAVISGCHPHDDVCNQRFDTGGWRWDRPHTSYYQSSTGASKTGLVFYVALSKNGFR